MGEEFEVLSALVDGEPVESAALEAALEDPRGRQALLAFVRLRHAAQDDDVRPRAEFYQRVRRDMSVPWRIMRQRVPLPLAAAAVLCAALASSVLSSEVFRGERQPSRPPDATRVLRFEPGVDWQTQP